MPADANALQVGGGSRSFAIYFTVLFPGILLRARIASVAQRGS